VYSIYTYFAKFAVNFNRHIFARSSYHTNYGRKIMSVVMKEVDVHSDSRGFVFEPIAEDSLQHQHNAHVVISQPGAVRGNHYHLNGTEMIAVMGPAVVRIQEDDKIRDIEIPVQRVYRFIIPPLVPHAIKNTGDQSNILIAFNTVDHDPQNPDVVREVLIED
jgi:UDP-2-acetamido-2,6-beta-L-arabino-hexul-4-ose reductase